MRSCAALALMLLQACASSVDIAGDAGERFSRYCQSLGRIPGTEAFRACVENEDTKAAVATQREYDRKALRRVDCVDPKVACEPPWR